MASPEPDPSAPHVSADLSPVAPRPSGHPGASIWLAAVLAGVLAWLGGETIHGRFDPPPASGMTMGPVDPAVEARGKAAALRFDRLSAGGAFGFLGAALGLGLGLAGGRARRSTVAALVAGLVGLLLGGAAGFGAGAVTAPYYRYHHRSDMSDLVAPLLMHAAIWLPIGLVAGLVLGLGWGGSFRRPILAALGGLVGALLGTLLFNIIGMLAFPLAKTDDPVAAEWGARLFACLIVAITTAFGALVAAQDPRPKPARASNPAG